MHWAPSIRKEIQPTNANGALAGPGIDGPPSSGLLLVHAATLEEPHGGDVGVELCSQSGLQVAGS